MTTIPHLRDAPADFILSNAQLVLPDRVVHGALRVCDGRIDALGPDAEGEHSIDLAGDYLLPGLIELHTDHLDVQLVPRGGVAWPPMPAVLAHDAVLAAAGITTALNALALGDLEDGHPRSSILFECVDALDAARAQALLRCDHWLHLRCELAHPDLPALVQRLCGHDRVRLLSLMDHTPGQRQYRDIAHYRRHYARSGVIWNDVEFTALVDARREQQQRLRGKHLEFALDAAYEHRLLVASHDDTSAEDVTDAYAAGAKIAEFPTTLEAARAAREAGMAIVAGAPNLVRGGSHSGNVAAIELARANCLDVLSSDFVPGSLLSGAFILAAQPGWNLPLAVATVTQKPAHLLGFADRGAIAVGLRADLVRVRHIQGQPIVAATWADGLRRY